MSPPRYQVAARAPFSLLDLALRRESLLILLIALIVVVNAHLSPYFLDFYNLSDMTANFSEKAILALAMALLIIGRDIDLSVAAIVALSSLAMGYAASLGLGPWPLAALGLTTGLACGLVNGLIATVFELPSIVVTIGTMSLFRGLASVALGDQAFTHYPPALLAAGQDYVAPWLPFPLSFVLFLTLALAFAALLHATPFGRRLFALGSNPVAARFSGVPVKRIRTILFALSGLMAGLAGVLLTARIGSTRPNIATGWELEAVTVVVLGGIGIEGGRGSIPGVVLAALALGLATFGMGLLNVPGVVMSVFVGLLLIGAIASPIIILRFLGRRLSWWGQMPQIAFKMFLNPGQEAEYRRRHDAIWPELRALLKESGVRDYVIYLDPDSHSLFAVLRRPHLHHMDELPNHPIMRKWWAHMADIMRTNPDGSPVVVPLIETFHLK